jgi:hypothetical protein
MPVVCFTLFKNWMPIDNFLLHEFLRITLIRVIRKN